MKKNLKLIIGGLIAIALLAGAICLLKVTEEPAETPDTTPESRLQYEKSSEKIESIYVENDKNSYTIVKNGEKFAVSGLGEDVSLNEELLAAAAESVSRLVTEKVIEENASDLGKYGLDPAKLKITVKFSDGAKTEKILLIGTELLDSSLSYFAFEGENTVYAVKNSPFSALPESAEEFISEAAEESEIPENTDGE